MMTSFCKQVVFGLVAATLVTAPITQAARAAVIGTETAIDAEERVHRLEHINTVLAREDVRTMLIDLGVNPNDAAGRVAALTDEELQVLEAQLDELPAGSTSLIGVVGIVAIVLVILELLDVTDLFTQF